MAFAAQTVNSKLSVQQTAAEEAVMAKLFRRLTWFIFLASALSYLDRINISFAALSMNKALGLTATAYGLSATIFYIGYVVCEIPSNAMMVKFGARVWIPRIMITWGLASAATMFVYDATSLYVTRFLVGVAEAGLLPGILLFLTFWFPKKYRGRATGNFVIALAVAPAVGSLISGLILKMPPYFGIESWRWLFLIQGLPATILGIIGLFYLADNPMRAKWLTAGEKATLKQMFDREEAPAPKTAHTAVWRQMFNKEAILLGLAYFGLVTTISTNATWVPLIVKEVMTKFSISEVAFVSAVPPAVAIVALMLWSRSSDRSRERVWHTLVALIIGAAGWLLVGSALSPEWRFLGLICCSIGGWCGMGLFWTIPAPLMTEEARALGLAFINTIGLLSSAATPTIIGVLRDHTGSFAIGTVYTAFMLGVAAVLILIVTADKKALLR
jgi:ACS family 4-hydroxyphenylacetate permease-like MFS transporter